MLSRIRKTARVFAALARGRARRLRFGVVAVALCLPLAASGQPVLADLSSYVVEITTGFVGDRVVLFGAADAGNDVVVVVRGPPQSITVREKRRVAGIWVNAPGLQFVQVPSFYAVAATRPLDEMLSPEVLANEQIGADHVLFLPAPGAAESFSDAEIAEHRAALLKLLQQRGLYGATVGTIAVQGGRLFRTDLVFPSDVPTGQFLVGVYTVVDGGLQAVTTPLSVRKAGLEAELYRFAHESPALYGALAVLVAFAAGFLPTVVRRLR